MTELDDLDRRLLDEFQRGFPMVPRPFEAVARTLGIGETEVIERLSRLKARGAVGRVGPVFRPGAVGASTLAAMSVPAGRLDEVAHLVNAYPEVNHNYGREHRLNLWFVVTGPDRGRVDAVLAEVEARTGIPVMDLPMERDYHLDLGFPLWN